jgi:hypothetical protein
MILSSIWHLILSKSLEKLLTTDWTMPSSNTSTSQGLLDLPLEIRQIIYGLLIPACKCIWLGNWKVRELNVAPQPPVAKILHPEVMQAVIAVSATCRKLHNEMNTQLYSTLHFGCHTIPTMAIFVERLPSQALTLLKSINLLSEANLVVSP